MAYRGETRCHECGAETESTCPGCNNGVCAEHTMSARVAGAPASAIQQADRIAKRLGGPLVCTTCLDRELAATRGPYDEVYRASDPVQAELIREALLEDGFDARALGTKNAALLGAGQHIFEQRIEVPRPQLEAARQLVEALLSEVELDEEGADSDEDGPSDPEGDLPPSPRKRLVAAVVALIFPGAAHFYTRRSWTGLCMTLTFFAGTALAISGGGFGLAGAATMLGAVVADALGGQLSVVPCNRGERSSVGAQLLHGLVLAGMVSLAAAAFQLPR